MARAEERPSVVCVSTTDWDEIPGSRQQVMSRLAAAGHLVVFVERQVGPEHLLRDPALRARKLAAWRGAALRRRAERLWSWQPPLVPPGRYYSDAANRLGQARLARRLRPVLRRLGVAHPVLWLYPPHSAPLLGRLGERLAVYHCIDRFAALESGRKRRVMLAQEERLLRAADLVFTPAAGLAALYGGLTRRPIGLVPSAADVARVQASAAVHPALAALAPPRLGVVGTLDARIDVELLAGLARARADWSLVLVGPVRPGRVDLGVLRGLPNVRRLGAVPAAELPAVLNGLDVGLVPYVLDERTRFVSPLKVYEYLAAGLPIVSADLPEVRPLGAWVRLVEAAAAGRVAAFRAAIEGALGEDAAARARRRAAAWAHTWDARVAAMWERVAGVLQG